MKKRGEKTGDLIDEKPPKLDEKQGRKLIIHCFLRCCSTGGEKSPKLDLGKWWKKTKY